MKLVGIVVIAVTLASCTRPSSEDVFVSIEPPLTSCRENAWHLACCKRICISIRNNAKTRLVKVELEIVGKIRGRSTEYAFGTSAVGAAPVSDVIVEPHSFRTECFEGEFNGQCGPLEMSCKTSRAFFE